MSSIVIYFGTGYGSPPKAGITSLIAIGEGAQIYKPPLIFGCVDLPAWNNCKKRRPFFLWTALIIFFHPSTCSFV